MAETYSVTTGTIAFAAATAKTVVELIAPATQPGRLYFAEVSFDGSASGAGVKVELVRFTATGTGTAYVPLRANGEGQNKAGLITAKVNDTVEPTGATPARTSFVPLSALNPPMWSLGREFYIPTSTILGVRVTSPVAINGAVNLEYEE